MRAPSLDGYRPGTSCIHRLPPGTRLSAALAAIVLTVALPAGHWPARAAIAATIAAVAALARLPGRALATRLLVLEPFAVGIAALALFQPGGPAIFVDRLARSTLCLLAMIVLTMTTRFVDLLTALRHARVPSLLITTLALMHRYLFLIVDELHRQRRARRCRTFVTGRALAWKDLASVVALLFARTAGRAERVYFAMCARGWRP